MFGINNNEEKHLKCIGIHNVMNKFINKSSHSQKPASKLSQMEANSLSSITVSVCVWGKGSPVRRNITVLV